MKIQYYRNNLQNTTLPLYRRDEDGVLQYWFSGGGKPGLWVGSHNTVRWFKKHLKPISATVANKLKKL